MAPVSDELRSSLDALSHQICDAEQFLLKQPGADKASVPLDVETWGVDSYLEVDRNLDGGCEICVSYYCSGGLVINERKPLRDFPVASRIELCEHIPDLLESALEAQEEVARDAIEAASSIEQALAKVKGK